jgi:hypothetical protein
MSKFLRSWWEMSKQVDAQNLSGSIYFGSMGYVSSWAREGGPVQAYQTGGTILLYEYCGVLVVFMTSDDFGMTITVSSQFVLHPFCCPADTRTDLLNHDATPVVAVWLTNSWELCQRFGDMASNKYKVLASGWSATTFC